VKVGSDAEAVGFAILVNLQRGWTKDERKRIDSDLRAAGLTLENFGRQLGAAATRERIRAALLEQSTLAKPLTHRAIAKQLDVHPELVNRECRDLMTQCVIVEEVHRFTEDGKEAPGTKPKAPTATEEQVKELLLENPQQSDNQIRVAVGLDDNHHRVVKRVRDRLVAAGAIPLTVAREGSDGKVRNLPNAMSPPVPTAPAPRPQPAAPPSPVPPSETCESAPPDEDSGILNQVAVLLGMLTVKAKRTLLSRLLRELPDEDRAEVLNEIGK
jgi:hypothetical protein